MADLRAQAAAKACVNRVRVSPKMRPPHDNKGKFMKLAQAATAVSLASAALAIAAGLPAHAATNSGAVVKCSGVNACKGTSDCKSAEHLCKGQNVCKGHGFVWMTSSDCTARGGTVITTK